ncbi:MAG: PilZ domain-containing protein [Gammaproteobacteria bacterium]|jgi:hypothetical protein
MENISRTGAALVVAGVPPLGNIVEVTLVRSSTLPPAVNATARGYVVWVKDNELDLLWIERCGWDRPVDRVSEAQRQRPV